MSTTIAHVLLHYGFRSAKIVYVNVVEFIFEIVHIFLFFVPNNSGTSFVAPISCLALRASLIPVLALVFVARSAHWESTFVASHEQFPVGGNPDIVAADLADLAAQMLQRSGCVRFRSDDNELVTFMGARDETCVSFHGGRARQCSEKQARYAIARWKSVHAIASRK